MNERFDMNFKNKELRVWFYIMLPIAIVGFSILLFADYKYNQFAIILVMIGWLVYYAWRFRYRKSMRKNTGHS